MTRLANPLAAQTVSPTSRRVLGIIARHAGVCAFFLLLSGLWLRPLPWHLGDRVTGPGDPLTTAWRVVWPAQWALHHPAGFWQTNALYPARDVFARDELTLGESIIAFPVYAASGNPILAYNVTLIATLALSGLCTYACAWHFVRRRDAAMIAGMIVAFAPYHLAQIDHVGLLAVQFLPLIVLALDQAVKTGKWRYAIMTVGVAFLQAIAAGYAAYWAAIVVVVYGAYALVRWHGRVRTQAAIRLGITFSVALLLLLPIVIPFWRVAHTEGFARPTREVEYWSARPQTWLAATPQNLIYGPLVRAHAWTWTTEMYLFPGAVAVLLAVAAFALRAHRPVRWLALALVVTGFILTLGPTLHLTRHDTGRLPLPYALLYHLVPGGSALRVPARAAPIAMLGLALLAAIGWRRCGAWLRHRFPRRVSSIAPLLIVALLIIEYMTAPVQAVRAPQLNLDEATTAHWLRMQSPSVIAVLPNLRAPVTMALAATNRHRFINGDAEILPPASAALFATLQAFPDPASLRALRVLGVGYVVVDRSAYAPAAWGTLRDRIGTASPDLALVASLSDGLIVAVTPMQTPFDDLRHVVPTAATVFLAGTATPDRAYFDRALAAFALRDRQVFGDLRTGWEGEPQPPRAGTHYDIGIFAAGDTIPESFDAAESLWSDGTLTAYRARTG